MARGKRLIDIGTAESDLQRQLRDLQQKQAKLKAVLTKDLPTAKIKVLESLQALDLENAADSYTAYLTTVVAHFPSGIRIALLKKVFPNQVKLDEARNLLGSKTYHDPKEDKDKKGKGFLEEGTEANDLLIIKATEAGMKAIQTSAPITEAEDV
jgi:hypothetical protein